MMLSFHNDVLVQLRKVKFVKVQCYKLDSDQIIARSCLHDYGCNTLWELKQKSVSIHPQSLYIIYILKNHSWVHNLHKLQTNNCAWDP